MHIITTLVTNSQPENHQASDLHANQFGNNTKMVKNKILELRNKRGWSLKQLEDKTGISAQHLNRLETGHPNARLNETNIDLLCKVFHVSVAELFGEAKSASNDISQADMAITQILQAVLSLLLKKKHILPNEIDSIFTQANELYRAHHLPQAVKIVSELHNTLAGGSHLSEKEVIHKLLELSPLGSA